MAELGRVALMMALAAAGWALLGGISGVLRDHGRSTRNAGVAMVAAAAAITVASGALFTALLTRDFSVEYVAQYTSRSLSIFYTLGAFWAGQAGSLLLWAWILSICGVLVVAQPRSRERRALMPWMITVLAGILLFFLVLVFFYADPFARLVVAPPDGQGLNPLLQNYGQWIHPLTLYAGFVGFSVPFAFTVSALITGKLGDRWLLDVRRWTLWSWILLTVGIMLGARWAYVELGWGGYWAWDPVENASLLPWLTATIFLHSAAAQENRGVMRTWNVTLLPATFAFGIFGTFLTRSGIVSSVHAFAQSAMGPLLLGFTGFVVLVSTGLIVWRLPKLGRAAGYGSLVSRESSFLAASLLFIAMTVVVFGGTVYPLVVEAIHGTKVAVGPAFFQTSMVPLSILLLVLVGICPLLAWRRTDPSHLWRGVSRPLAVGGVVLALGLITSDGRHVLLAVVTAIGASALTTVVGEITRGLRARHRVRADAWPTAVHHLFGLTPRKYGGPIAHAGMIVLFIGIALNLSMKTHTQTTVAVGNSAQVGGYSLTLQTLTSRQEGSQFATVAAFAVRSGGSPDGTIVDVPTEERRHAVRDRGGPHPVARRGGLDQAGHAKKAAAEASSHAASGFARDATIGTCPLLAVAYDIRHRRGGDPPAGDRRDRHRVRRGTPRASRLRAGPGRGERAAGGGGSGRSVVVAIIDDGVVDERPPSNRCQRRWRVHLLTT